MKLKKLFLLFGLSLLMTVFMSTTCEKDDPDDPGSGGCTAFVSGSTTGALNGTYCFEVLVSYDYSPGESFSMVTRQDGDPIYSCTLQSYSGFTGPGTYSCGYDEPAYIELVVHGTDNEFYKAQSGTLTITEVDGSHLKGSFNVVAKGYYNEQTINFSGTINM